MNGERDELNRQVFTARAEREDMVSLAERSPPVWLGQVGTTRAVQSGHATEFSHAQGIRISANSDFRYFAISEAAPGVNFRQCLGRDPKITSEGAGGRRLPAPSEVILVNRPKHCRKLTPSAASEMAKYLKSLFAEIPVP